MKKSDGKVFDVPTLYDINGSSNFYNKADNGICVYRDKQLGVAYVYTQKVKFSHWGEEGMVSYAYEPASTRYYKGTPDYSNWLNDGPKQNEVFEQPHQLQPNNDFLSLPKETDIVINNDVIDF